MDKRRFDVSERFQFLQSLVTEFQDTDAEEAREQILANLANFAYDPINYPLLRRLNVLQLFVDQLSSTNSKLLDFACGGLCNCCLDKSNKELILQENGVAAIIHCLSSANEETVLNAISTLMFLITPQSRAEITSPPVIECMMNFSLSSNPRLSNLAQIFLADLCTQEQIATATAVNQQGLIGIPLPSSSLQ